jgi:hypothetical protein
MEDGHLATVPAPTLERGGSTSALDALQLPLPPLLQAHQFSSVNPAMMMTMGQVHSHASLLSHRTVSMPATGVCHSPYALNVIQPMQSMYADSPIKIGVLAQLPSLAPVHLGVHHVLTPCMHCVAHETGYSAYLTSLRGSLLCHTCYTFESQAMSHGSTAVQGAVRWEPCRLRPC